MYEYILIFCTFKGKNIIIIHIIDFRRSMNADYCLCL